MTELAPSAASKALKAVEAAFPDRPFPKGWAVSKEDRWFDEGGQAHVHESPEARTVAQFFAGRPWRDSSPTELLGWRPANVSPFFLAPRAFAYYVPAFMRAFLTGPLDPVGFAILEAVLLALTPQQAWPPGSSMRWSSTSCPRCTLSDAIVRCS